MVKNKVMYWLAIYKLWLFNSTLPAYQYKSNLHFIIFFIRSYVYTFHKEKEREIKKENNNKNQV